MGEWVSWAMNNVSPSQLQSAMGWAKENVDKDQLQAIAAKLAGGETSATTTSTTTPATASSWSSWLTSSKSTAAPVAGAPAPAPSGAVAPPAPTVAGTPAGVSSWFNSISSTPAAGTTTQSTKQKYITLAIKNWKYSIPVALWAFSSVMSMLWWVIPIAIVVGIIKKKNAAA